MPVSPAPKSVAVPKAPVVQQPVTQLAPKSNTPDSLSAAKPVIAPAPLTLASLNKNKSTPKADPKVPTPENVSQLKNALAAALSRHKATPPIISKPAAASQAPSIPQASMKEIPAKEVPEDILKKILKID
jgi:hypothetical protein